MVEYDKDGQPIFSDDGTDQPWRKRYAGGYGQGRRWPSEAGAPNDPLDAVYSKQIFTDHITPGQTLGFPIFDGVANAPEPPSGESNAVYVTGATGDEAGLYQWNGSAYELVKGKKGPQGDTGSTGPQGKSAFGNFGFEYGEVGTTTTPMGWYFSNGGSATAVAGSFSTNTPPNSGSSQSYGSDSFTNDQSGKAMGYWEVAKYFHVEETGFTLTLDCWAEVSADPDGTLTFTAGQETFIGEDDVFFEVHCYDDQGAEISLAAADQYSTTASHQEWQTNGTTAVFNKWIPLTHSLTIPTNTETVKVAIVNTDANNTITALGWKSGNSGCYIDDFDIEYPKGLVETSRPFNSYTDSEAISAVESHADALNIDISGDATTFGGLFPGQVAVRAQPEDITANWKFLDGFTVTDFDPIRIGTDADYQLVWDNTNSVLNFKDTTGTSDVVRAEFTGGGVPNFPSGVRSSGSSVLTAADEGVLDAGTLDTLDSTDFIQADGSVTATGKIDIAENFLDRAYIPPPSTSRGGAAGDQDDELVHAHKKYTVTQTAGTAPTTGAIGNAFDLNQNDVRWDSTSTYPVTIEISGLPNIYAWEAIGANFRYGRYPDSLTVELYDSSSATWTTVINESGGVGDNAESTGFSIGSVSKARISFSGVSNNNYGQIALARFFGFAQSGTGGGAYLSAGGGNVYGDVSVTGTLSESGNNVLTTSNEGSLDAGTLDGLDSTQFLRSDTSDTTVGKFNISKQGSSFALRNPPSSTANWASYQEFYADNTATLTRSAWFGYSGSDTLTLNNESGTDIKLSPGAGGVTRINNDRILTTVDEGTLNAGTLDGLDSTQFLRSDQDDTTTGKLAVEGPLELSGLATDTYIERTGSTLSMAVDTTNSSSQWAFELWNDGAPGATGASRVFYVDETDMAYNGTSVSLDGHDHTGDALSPQTVETKVHNGIVNGGHSDFATAQAAIDYAGTNGYHRVQYPAGNYGGITVNVAGLVVEGLGTALEGTTRARFVSSTGVAVNVSAGNVELRNIAADSRGSGTHAFLFSSGGATVVNCLAHGSDNNGFHFDSAQGQITGSSIVGANIPGSGIRFHGASTNCVADGNRGAGSITSGGTGNIIGDNT